MHKTLRSFFKLKAAKSNCIKSMLIILSIIIASTALQLIFPSKVYTITLKELGDKISRLSRDEENLLEEILVSETMVELQRKEINSLNEKLSQFESQLEGLYKKRDELKNSIDNKREILEEKIVYTYKYGNNDIAKIMIGARDINEFVNNMYLFINIMKNEAELIENLRFEKEEDERVLRKSEEKKREIEDLKEEIIIEEQKLLENIKKNQLLLDQVESEKKEFQNLLGEIKRRIAEIQPPGLKLIGEWEMTATAYYSGGGGISGNGITAIGLRVRKGIVAVDPRVIPLGTKLYIPGYGEALAADTGGWIKGNRIDLAYETLEECFRFGRRRLRVYLVEN